MLYMQYRPTYEETKLTLDLEKGLVKHFEDEYFDVWDEQDDTEIYNTTGELTVVAIICF